MSEAPVGGRSPESEPTPPGGSGGVPQGAKEAADLPEAAAGGSVSERDRQASDPPHPPGGWAEFTPRRPLEQDEIVEILPEPERAEAPRAEGAGSGVNASAPVPPLAGGRRRQQRVLSKESDQQPPRVTPEHLTPVQRLLVLDTWQRSGLPAADVAAP